MINHFLKNIFILSICAAFFFSCGNKKNTAAENKTDSTKVSDPISILTEKIKADTNNASLYYERSKWNLNMKHLGSAEFDIKKALSIDSSKAAYYMQYADVSFANMNVEQTEELIKKAITMQPENIDAYLKLSEFYLYIKKYEESLKYADEALKIDKHKAKAYFIKGFVFKETKDTASAVSSFQTAVEQEPNYYDAYLLLGNLYAPRHRPLAVEYYNRALTLEPHSTEAYYARGLYFQNSGELDKAVADYKQILAFDPDYPQAYYNLGFIEANYKNNYRKAVEYFTQAIAKKKYYVEALYNRGYCYEELGDKKNAVADYGAALSIVPTYKLAEEALKKLKESK
jgi:tetratricopeptide (TPR) repeat protein